MNAVSNYQQLLLEHILGKSSDEQLLSQIGARSSDTDRERQLRLAVYRNNYRQSLIEALESTYPVILRLIGSELFRAIASEYVDDRPPANASLLYYGDAFPDHLEQHSSCQQLPYLADVARIEWHYIQCFHGPDSDVITMHDLLAIDEDLLAQVQFVMHPSCRLLDSAFPSLDIWQANLETEVPELCLDELNPSNILLYRDDNLQVVPVHLSVEAYLFLLGLFRGLTIESTWQQLQASQNPTPDESVLYELLSYFLSLPIFTRLRMLEDQP